MKPASLGARQKLRPNDRRSIGMAHPRATIRARTVLLFVTAPALLIATTGSLQAQQFNVGAPAGAAGGSVVVGQPLGAASFPDWSTPSLAPFSGRGRGSHVPAVALSTPGSPVFAAVGAQLNIPSLPTIELPQYGELELPAEFVTYGPKDGMVLDAAIERLVKQNLDLEAARMEVPMADADILTANLRANPIFYADTELQPYGHFSFLRPGGPPQYDVNISYPLDVTFKRLARTRSAREARSVTEAQLQDAIRTQIDNLYTVFEDDVAAGLTLQFSTTFARGIRLLHARIDEMYKAGQAPLADLQAVQTKLYQADLQVKEARQTKTKANRALALMLNLPLTDYEQIEKLDVLDPVGKVQELPVSREELLKTALQKRPDLLAWKYGVRRAAADLKVAQANAYPDIYVLYQPYTFQNNAYLGVQSATSWWLGMTASLPIYNRNQGNITRSRINITQTEVQLASAERVVINDVLSAVQELEQSRVAVLQFRNDIDPPAKEVRNAAYRRWQGGAIPMQDYLDAQQNYNDIVRQYRDALVRHRRAILDLNTAVGERVLP
jgi:cobalt-zinc-cadmium efflux system outer membrane protein